VVSDFCISLPGGKTEPVFVITLSTGVSLLMDNDRLLIGDPTGQLLNLGEPKKELLTEIQECLEKLKTYAL